MRKTGLIRSVLVIILMVLAPAMPAYPEELSSPLLSAESLGYADYDALIASLQDKLDCSNASDQSWLNKLWSWVCYVLHDVLHDPRVVEYVKIEYWTTTSAGERIPVTGLAILPQKHILQTTVPMVSFQHPTQVERKYSPSMFNKTNMWDDKQFSVPFGTMFAMAGFAVAMADYPGMGSNTNVHPYCTESLANSVVDMIRAVRDYLQANTNTYAQWDSRLYLTGYSEGGYATVMAARDLQVRYAGEFTNVVGVAGLDGPYSLSDTMRGVMLNSDTNFNSPYFLPYTVNGYDSVYAAQDPVFVFTNAVKYFVPTEPDFAGKLQWMCIAGTNTSDDMNDLIFKATPYVGPRSILTDFYLTQLSNSASVLCGVLASNDAYFAWTPQMKMRLYHYPKDDLVPYGNATNACNAFAGRSAPQTELATYGEDWPISWLIELLKVKMGSYHGAAAPVATVGSILWLHDLAYGRSECQQFPPQDMDGDGFSDLVLYDENTGRWQMLLSNRMEHMPKSNAESEPYVVDQIMLGGPGFMSVLSDFDGDGKADPAVYHEASGLWTIWLSWFDYVPVYFPLGGYGSVPVPQDYDGDRIAEPCVYNAQYGLWTIYQISSNKVSTVQFGGPGYVPVKGDYDGDGKADPAVYHETEGIWFAALSGRNYALASAPCGGAGYIPMPADYDGDGKTDPCVYHESDGSGRMLLSTSEYAQMSLNAGGPGFAPVVGDCDGDGKADLMLYDEGEGLWVGIFSANDATACWYFGGPGGKPIQ